MGKGVWKMCRRIKWLCALSLSMSAVRTALASEERIVDWSSVKLVLSFSTISVRTVKLLRFMHFLLENMGHMPKV